MRSQWPTCLAREDGQAMTEYGMIIGLAVAGAVLALPALRAAALGLYNSILQAFAQVAF